MKLLFIKENYYLNLKNINQHYKILIKQVFQNKINQHFKEHLEEQIATDYQENFKKH